MGRDRQGNIRGVCTELGCVCRDYETPAEGNDCGYCNHGVMMHLSDAAPAVQGQGGYVPPPQYHAMDAEQPAVNPEALSPSAPVEEVAAYGVAPAPTPVVIVQQVTARDAMLQRKEPGGNGQIVVCRRPWRQLLMGIGFIAFPFFGILLAFGLSLIGKTVYLTLDNDQRKMLFRTHRGFTPCIGKEQGVVPYDKINRFKLILNPSVRVNYEICGNLVAVLDNGHEIDIGPSVTPARLVRQVGIEYHKFTGIPYEDVEGVLG